MQYHAILLTLSRSTPGTHTLFILHPQTQTVQQRWFFFFFFFSTGVHQRFDDCEFIFKNGGEQWIWSEDFFSTRTPPDSAFAHSLTQPPPANTHSHFSCHYSGGRRGFMAHNHHLSLTACGLAVWVWLSNPQLELRPNEQETPSRDGTSIIPPALLSVCHPSHRHSHYFNHS